MNVNEELSLVITRAIDEVKGDYPVLARIISAASGREKVELRVRQYIVAEGVDDVYEAIAQVVMQLESQ